MKQLERESDPEWSDISSSATKMNFLLIVIVACMLTLSTSSYIGKPFLFQFHSIDYTRDNVTLNNEKINSLNI